MSQVAAAVQTLGDDPEALDMIYMIGPRHGGPAIVANAYLEGIYSEVYPNISADVPA